MRKRSDWKYKKVTIAVILSVMVIFVSLFCIEKRIRKFSSEMSEYYCRAQLSKSVSTAVREVLETTGAKYTDLSAEIFDENGKFVSAELCTKNTNVLQSMIVTEINESISGLSDTDIKIPAGTLSGFFWLNGKGPEIKIRLVPVGSAETELKSCFESAGINQTCHKISLDITVSAKAVYPSGSEAVTVKMNCILAENIIAGEVPDGLIVR